MIFLKHVQYRFNNQGDLQSRLAHVRETATRVPGVRLRDFFILLERDECILVMECPNEAANQEWRKLCPPPTGATDWVESAMLAEEWIKRRSNTDKD